MPDAVHRLPGALARHDHQRASATPCGSSLRIPTNGSCCGRIRIASRPRSTRSSASRARSVASRGSPRSTRASAESKSPPDRACWSALPRPTATNGAGMSRNALTSPAKAPANLPSGYGEHACVGMGLARLEGAAVLAALVERVGTMELDGAPVRKRNNLIRSFRSLPVTVTPKSSWWTNDDRGGPHGDRSATPSAWSRRRRHVHSSRWCPRCNSTPAGPGHAPDGRRNATACAHRLFLTHIHSDHVVGVT